MSTNPIDFGVLGEIGVIGVTVGAAEVVYWHVIVPFIMNPDWQTSQRIGFLMF
jgi:hypothetical protein